MKKVMLTNEQARYFMLLKQGLAGSYKFAKEQGICDYIRQSGCIQFDPIDVCGKNAELVLQSRVDGFSKDMLYKLLYIDRKLVDYFDKNMSIFSIEDWKFFSRQRAEYENQGRSREQVNEVIDGIKSIIHKRKFACSKDINLKEQVDWAWNSTTLSRAALETLYFRGELIVHHKKGTIKYYSLANEYIPKETLKCQDPNLTLEEHLEWRVLRRIGGVGLLWNRPSDAWLGIDGLKASNRSIIFNKLLAEGKIIEITIKDIDDTFYCLANDSSIIQTVLDNSDYEKRTEFIAPLDNMLWDRKLIKKIFNFEYKWEIYTPIAERKYGYYVLPVLWGDRFIARIEVVNDKKLKQLLVKNIWFEEDIDNCRKYEEDICDCLMRFANFNNCESVIYEWKM